MSSDSSLERRQQNLSEILVPDTEIEDSNGHEGFGNVGSRPYRSDFANMGDTFVPCTQEPYDNNYEATAGTSDIGGATCGSVFTGQKLFGASAPSTNGTTSKTGEWRPMQSESRQESVQSTNAESGRGAKEIPPLIQISSSSSLDDVTAGSSNDWHLNIESDSQATQAPPTAADQSKHVEMTTNLVGYDVEDVSPPPSNENVQQEDDEESNYVEPNMRTEKIGKTSSSEVRTTEDEKLEENVAEIDGSRIIVDKPESSSAEKMDVEESKQVSKKRSRKDDLSAISASEDSEDDFEDNADKLHISMETSPSRGSTRGGRGRGRGRGAGRGRGRGRGRGAAFTKVQRSSLERAGDDDEMVEEDEQHEPELEHGADAESDESVTPVIVNIGSDVSGGEEKTPGSSPTRRAGRPKRRSPPKGTPKTELRKSLRSQTPRSEKSIKKSKKIEEDSHSTSDEEGVEEEEAEKVEKKKSGRIGRPPNKRAHDATATPPTVVDASDDASKKRRRRTSSSLHSTTDKEDTGESRQLRKRGTPVASPSPAPTRASKSKVSTTPKQVAVTTPKRVLTPRKMKETPKSAPTASTRVVAGRRRAAGKSPSASTDPYDFESNADMQPLPPLKHLHVARSTFGEVKFTKSPTSDKKQRYANTSKNAEIRYQRANADTQILDSSDPDGGGGGLQGDSSSLVSSSATTLDSSQLSNSATPVYSVDTVTYVTITKKIPKSKKILKTTKFRRSMHHKTTKNLSPSLRKQISPDKSLSSGELADISSYESKLTSDTSNPKSSGKSYLTKSQSRTKSRVSFEKNMNDDGGTSVKKTGSPGRRSSSTGSSGRGAAGSYSLFSDVEQKISDNFDDENFLTPSDKKENRRRKPVVSHGDDSEDDDLREIERMDDNEEDENEGDFETEESTKTAVVRKTKRPRASTTDYGSGAERTTPPVQKRRKKNSDRSNLTPKPKEPHLDAKSPEEQLAADFPSPNTANLSPGARVLAKWKDGTFYPGNVIVNLGLGRYKVRFLDRAYRDMPAPDIVPVARLKPGDVLMVKNFVGEDDETELQPVTILSTPPSNDSQEWYGGIFEVKNSSTDKTEKVAWDRMVIDVDQTKAFVTTSINVYAQNIVADNISDTRARRNRGVRSTSPSTSVDADADADAAPQTPPATQYKPRTPRGRGGGTPRGRGRGRSVNASPASDAAADAISPRSQATATSARTPRGGRGRGRGSGRGRGAYENLDASRTSVASPYRHSGTVIISRRDPVDQLFEGLKFVLTSANRAKPKEDGSSSEEEKPIVLFNKKQVRQMIEERGGTVVEDFSMIMDVSSNCYLIADQHYRTHKYLSALARAVPCVSHVWIHDSCQKNKLLPFKNYVLPAGQSLETNQIIEWHEECPKLLADLTVYVYTENRPANPTALDFVQIWSPLVSSMGATVVTQMPDDEEAHLDLLLTDVSCPSNVLQRAAEIGANAVSSEWLIQAIITGSKPEADGHPKYRYDFVEQASP